MKIFVLLHTQPKGELPKIALECVTTAQALAQQTSGTLTAGIIGTGAAQAAAHIAGCGAVQCLTISCEDVAQARYATDAAAAETLIKAANAEIVLAPGTSRFTRCLPGVAFRLNAAVDTRITGLQAEGEKLNAQRWFYRQRIFSTFSRKARPWFLLTDAGVSAPFQADNSEMATQEIELQIGADDLRTQVTGVQAPSADAQTIKPDAALLFVAGAGWTKKQKDGQLHIAEAGRLIQDFLRKSMASLGSSKSLVDLQSEGVETLNFMTHMNQVGQTGSTPRHAKGIAACCHGEEPHVVGWRFINERRAINLDPNCGWAQGKADVVYVGDAFEIMARVNAMLE